LKTMLCAPIPSRPSKPAPSNRRLTARWIVFRASAGYFANIAWSFGRFSRFPRSPRRTIVPDILILVARRSHPGRVENRAAITGSHTQAIQEIRLSHRHYALATMRHRGQMAARVGSIFDGYDLLALVAGNFAIDRSPPSTRLQRL
jgi:hypothetical protein